MRKFLKGWKENLTPVSVTVVTGKDCRGYINDFDDLGIVLVTFPKCVSTANRPTLIPWANVKTISSTR